MYKYELLRLLDDAEVQRKILKIVNEPNVFEEPQEEISETRQTISENLPAADDDAEKNSQRATDTERLLNALRGEYFKVKSDLAQSEQRIKNLDRQLQKASNENLRLNNSLEKAQQRARDFKEETLAWKNSCEDERQRAKDLQRELDAAQDKNSELEAQLQQRFARGWELFKKYPRVGAHARQLLQTGVFPHEDNFMSFICGGAQTNSLEKIWDVLRECVISGKQQDAEILWEVFEYCLELVNSSKAQPGYSILPVKEGDRFDFELHSEGSNSRAQGRISNIYLRGYCNDYNGKIIRKSIVQVS